MPAAPPPMMTTFFLPFLLSLRRPSEDMFAEGKFDCVGRVRPQLFIACVSQAKQSCRCGELSHLAMKGWKGHGRMQFLSTLTG